MTPADPETAARRRTDIDPRTFGNLEADVRNLVTDMGNVKATLQNWPLKVAGIVSLILALAHFLSK